MQTIRQIVKIEDDRQLSLTFPSEISSGLMEVTIFLQPVVPEAEHSNKLNLFGFLAQRIDPIAFQTDLRNDLNPFIP